MIHNISSAKTKWKKFVKLLPKEEANQIVFKRLSQAEISKKSIFRYS